MVQSEWKSQRSHSMLMIIHFLVPECVSEPGKTACEEIGGDCVTERDGYYYVSSLCVALGVFSLVFYIIPTARRLQCTWSILMVALTEVMPNLYSTTCKQMEGELELVDCESLEQYLMMNSTNRM